MKSKQNINYLSLLSNLLSLALGIVLSVVLLLSVIRHYSCNETYLKQQFQKNNIAAATGFSEPTLTQIIRQMTGYLSGRESSIHLTLPVNGKETPVFNNRELAYLLDVKVIFVLLDKIKQLGLLLLLTVLIPFSLYVYFSCRKRRNAKTVWLQRRYWMNIFKILAFNAAFTLILTGGLTFMMLTNFDKYFTYFHRFLFDADLWLLNSYDRLSQMLPKKLFYDIILQIMGHYAVISLILGAAGLIFFAILKKDETAL